MPNARKILIVKTGFSEFLDRGISTTVSLGDVLMCTAILHLYKNDKVTWVTSFAARQLLESNPYINELLIFGPATFKKIARASYDVFINLEKDIGICTFLSTIKARQRHGFYFDQKIHDISTYNNATAYLLSGQENHKDVNKTGFEILFDAVGAKWQGEGVIYNRKHRVAEKFDIGFNYSVGTKWPTKGWPTKKWEALEKILGSEYSISWQQGHKNILKYIDWIDSCRLIVTSDSLGQAIGHALKKKVITLYGPTDYRRMQGVENIHVICSTLKCPYMPCFLPICKNDKFCMDYIEEKKVATQCRKLLR